MARPFLCYNNAIDRAIDSEVVEREPHPLLAPLMRFGLLALLCAGVVVVYIYRGVTNYEERAHQQGTLPPAGFKFPAYNDDNAGLKGGLVYSATYSGNSLFKAHTTPKSVTIAVSQQAIDQFRQAYTGEAQEEFIMLKDQEAIPVLKHMETDLAQGLLESARREKSPAAFKQRTSSGKAIVVPQGEPLEVVRVERGLIQFKYKDQLWWTHMTDVYRKSAP